MYFVICILRLNVLVSLQTLDTMEDAELLEIAKKNRSVLNMQTLEKLAIKTILKNFDKFPTTALESLGKIINSITNDIFV